MQLPRHIFTFWHDGNPPPLATRCIHNMRRMNPTWTVTVLTDRDLPPATVRPDIHRLGPQHRADWVRLWALRRYGGVWLDSTVVLFRPLDDPDGWPGAARGNAADELRCFAIGRDHPEVLENWVLAAPRGSQFVRDWFASFDEAVRMGLGAYKDHLRRTDRMPAWMPMDSPEVALPYLTMHAIAVNLQAERPTAVIGRRYATEGPFRLQVLSNWNFVCTAWRAVWNHRIHTCTPLLKLRGSESRYTQAFLFLGLFRPDASVAVQLGIPPSGGIPWVFWGMLLGIFCVCAAALGRQRRHNQG